MTRKLNSSSIVVALLQELLADGRVRCHTCHRQCVIAEGQTGWCRTRTVRGGRLHTLTYGRVLVAFLQSDREEAALPFPSRQPRPDLGKLELQFRLPLVSELAHQ